MSKQDIRWQQRFQNFAKAFARLKESLEEEDELNELERNGVVQRFEFTLELAWKTLKDYMQNEGLEFQLTPKGTIRQAMQSGLIDYGQTLIDALITRNELAHDYDGEKFEEAEEFIRDEVFPALEKLHAFFLKELNKNQMGLF
jgi:nucleotidyltransferase substrate binding protein (TIGR01987 family)